jgi:glycosyltransferase involved in cell wall biosynthesis
MATDAAAPAISVVMATYNGARFIAEQLDSVAAQTLQPRELVVGDDGSEDATLEIIARFAKRATFPVLVNRNQTRLGAAENFLTTCLRARGPIIALSDWDDVWKPNKLERVAPWFTKPSVGMVIHRAHVVDESLHHLGRSYPEIRRTTVQRARHIDPWFSGTGLGVFRKGLLEAVASHAEDRPREAGGHPMDHDDWIYLLSGSLSDTVLLAEDLVLYRQHGGSYMGAAGGRAGERIERGLRLDAAHFQRQGSMFRARRDFWVDVASDPGTAPGVRSEAVLSAQWSGHLAALSDVRAEVRDEGRGRAHRSLRLLRLVVAGGYRSRTNAGLGVRALAGDLLALIRPGSGPARSAPDELARRVAGERAAGRSVEAVMADLTRQGELPLYGSRWTPEMIRDLVFQARRGTEREPVPSGQRSPSPSEPESPVQPTNT